MKLFWLFLASSITITANAFTTPSPGGYPNKGLLKNGMSLFDYIQESSETLRSVSPKHFQYGTAEMKSFLARIGKKAKELKRGPVWVGDISLKPGGKLARHQTHQRGLDVDIAYLVKNQKTTGHRKKRFHNRFTEQFEEKQKVTHRFETETNYEFLKSVVEDSSVKKVFVGCGIFMSLYKIDQRKQANVMNKIYPLKWHEDHFHVRLHCPNGAKNCSETWWKNPNKTKKKQTKKKKKKARYSHPKMANC